MQLASIFTLLALIAGAATAQCEIACIQVLDPVCGSDGTTYSSACDLKIAACTTKQNLTVVSKGECQSAAGVNCTKLCTEELKPHCATNGVTYTNQCELDKASCRDPSVKFVSLGQCTSNSSNATIISPNATIAPTTTAPTLASTVKSAADALVLSTVTVVVMAAACLME
ncbi:hypothetical protein LEN26_009096 [Aphanomyces euteiches]|uniref:Kazal-like domain-containing protein n=1 Tax=Aphanomyces euteiches TaxID=100861 RepID=A0A6G0X6A0_9STRA|nr:hypothetical protein Ae201684_008121 [Aphanomyces euteiches]KAH9074582.1 hypothetical protein Ae201684P_022386 [Aphanomyces euteiches]KAH9108597.1 hypothetical protein AeMF1_016240 [Aphanomyces euteiches]KAH9128570.1 hypothetical protein LEN26_009096 [Aphanomyces euteiches]KAH9146028.1 hypothetical protein AeRB84_010086 [Aphanomyces euteiches]